MDAEELASIQRAAYPIAGPVMMGNCAQILFTGLLLSNFYHFVETPAWRRTSRLQKTTIWTVVVLCVGLTGLYTADIYYYGTLMTTSINLILAGTAQGTAEPLLVGLIAMIVQTTLVLRTVKVIQTPWRKLAYLVCLGVLIALSFTGSILATAWSVHYHFLTEAVDPGFIRMDFPTALAAWMWAAAVTDSTISVVYIVIIRQRLANGPANARSQSVLRMIVTTTLQSASYTSVLAVLSATMSQAFTLDGKFNVTCLPYAFWLPLAALYSLSLFTTLGMTDKVVDAFGQEHKRVADVPSWLASGEKRGSESTAFDSSRNRQPSNAVDPLDVKTVDQTTV